MLTHTPMPLAGPGPASVLIVSPKGYAHAQAFEDLALALVWALEQAGRSARIVRRPDQCAGPTIVLGGNLLPQMGVTRLPPNFILYNLEQVQDGSDWITGGYLGLMRGHPCWDYSGQNIARLQALGLNHVRHCPIGYAPPLTRIAAAAEPDIDVLFYGSMNPRRAEVLKALIDAGLKVHAVFGAYGEARDRLIARSRIVLNLHFYEAAVFEIVRVSYLLANRVCVVSETGGDRQLEAPFSQAVAFADHDGLVARCRALIADAAARDAIARQGFETFRAMPQQVPEFA